MLWVCIGGAAQLIVVSALWSWLPSFLNRVHGMPPDQAAVKAALVVLAGAVGSVVWGAWSTAPARAARAASWSSWRAVRRRDAGAAAAFAATGSASAAVTQFALIVLGGFLMTCTVGPVSAIVIDVIHPGVRATGASVLALFQNLFGLAAGPVHRRRAVRRLGPDARADRDPGSSACSRRAFLLAARSYEADTARAAEPPSLPSSKPRARRARRLSPPHAPYRQRRETP